MPARNRVTPHGEIEGFPLRGALTGNRGILHSGREIVRFHAHDSWVACSLRFKDRWSEQWVPHHFTWLYFYDEAVSFAAGHRPCGECRRASYKRYREAWVEAQGGEAPSAKEMNRVLHGERIVRGTHRRQLHGQPWRALPEGAFVELDGDPFLVLGPELVQWTREGYRARRPRPRRGEASAITPPSTLAVLRAGYPLELHPSALEA
ncbi:MAG TPA: hypothetical protein VHW67_09915 [Solirubrobacteraceae bacterium]|jgi:hypothetical protein|nr:hypothetical protein [Solirubrobacteraceae bacterium]